MAGELKCAGYVEYSVHGNSFKLGVAMQNTDTMVGTETLSGAANAFRTGVLPALQGVLSSDVIMGCIYLRRIIDTASAPVLEVFGDQRGTGTPGSMPTPTTVVLKFSNEIPEAAARGNWQLSGVSETANLGGSLDPVWVTGVGAALVTAMTAEHLDVAGAGYRMANVSTVLAGVPRVPHVIGNITAASFNLEFRTRRTRVTPISGAVTAIT